jgi:hypothetical protein
MMEIILNFASLYLIEFMGVLLLSALAFRWLAYRHSRDDQAYYSTFSRELEVVIDRDKEHNVDTKDVDTYLAKVLGEVGKRLPSRTLRGGKKENKKGEEQSRVVSFKDYMGGKQGLMLSIQSESSVFNADMPPNFTELTHRIMDQDKGWTKLLNWIPIESVSRMIDIVPGLFVVLGVFGTFVGISMALPEIAKIDFNNLEASGTILNLFVLNTTYAMKTSIAGIFFSLMLTVLNTLFPIKDKRFWTFKKVETALEMLWYQIHNDVTAEKELKTILPKLVNVLERLETHLSADDPKEMEDQEKVS